MSYTPEKIPNKFWRHKPGAPRLSRRLRRDVTVNEARQSMQVAEQLAPYLEPKTPYNVTTLGEGVTEWSDDANYPIIPTGHNLLAGERFRQQLRRERGIAAVLAALGIAGLTFASVQGGIHTKLAENVINALQKTADYLNRPQIENLRNFEDRARRFHSQR